LAKSKKERPRNVLIKAIDREFSRYIRLRVADSRGYAQCFTCERVKHWKEVDAGHFMSRAAFSTRWHELNVQFQCKHCNGFRSGEQYRFAQELDRKFGEGTAEKLVIESKQTRKYSTEELEELLAYYRHEAKKLGG
jgi:hypothetical protein